MKNFIGRQLIFTTKAQDSDVTVVVVSLILYDAAGKKVAVLAKGKRIAGKYEVEASTGQLKNGTYFYQLQANGERGARRMVITH